jgi:hypothetical protein
MRGHYTFDYLDNPWRDLFERDPNRRWLVGSPIDFDYNLRDAYAHYVVRSQLTARPDVRYVYSRAYGISPPGNPPAPGDDHLYLGRPKLHMGSLWGDPARLLEGQMYGRFLDPPTGQVADTIRYGSRLFTRRHILGSTLLWRRYDRDYAVLMYREQQFHGEGRRLAALAGVGSLGTLLLSAALAHPLLRRQLAHQARAVAPLTIRHRPTESIEVLIGFHLRQPTDLDVLLMRLDEILASPTSVSWTDTFEAKVEVVAVSTGNGQHAVFFNDLPGIALELSPLGEGRQGGLLRRLDTNGAIELTWLRTAVLREMALEPEQASIEALCRVLDRERPPGKAPRKPREALRKQICDLNRDLQRLQLDDDPIRYDRKVRRYIYHNVRVIWRPQPQ